MPTNLASQLDYDITLDAGMIELEKAVSTETTTNVPYVTTEEEMIILSYLDPVAEQTEETSKELIGNPLADFEDILEQSETTQQQDGLTDIDPLGGFNDIEPVESDREHCLSQFEDIEPIDSGQEHCLSQFDDIEPIEDSRKCDVLPDFADLLPN